MLAKGITVSRINNGTLTRTAQQPSFDAKDLASDDSGRTDLVDSQFLMFNILAIGYVLSAFLAHPINGLPAIPVALAGLTSVSALTCTANKAVATSSPVISGLSYDKITNRVTVRGVNLLAAGSGSPTVDLDGTTPRVDPGSTSTQFSFTVLPALPTGAHAITVTVRTPGGGAMQAAGTLMVSRYVGSLTAQM